MIPYPPFIRACRGNGAPASVPLPAAFRRGPLRTALLGAFAAVVVLAAARSQVPVEPAKNPFVADEWVLPAGEPALRPGGGSELITANCSMCHSLDYISTQPPLTRGQWTAGVEKMRTRFGAPILTNQVSAFVDYLTQNYGKP